MKKNKKALSPLVATVLLIVITIILALIIFLWVRSLTKEAITKFGGKNVELICNDVIFTAEYEKSSGMLTLNNLGNVPIYNFQLRIYKSRGHETKNIRDISPNWSNSTGLLPGKSFSGNFSNYFYNANKVYVIPILLGRSKGTEKTHVCADQFKEEIFLNS